MPHWNAFVANLEMHGVGRFWDPRLNDETQFPIAIKNGFGDLPPISPDDDQITSKLAALQFYHHAIPAPQPPPGSFDPAAAARGDELFSGKANCNSCHAEPIWADPAGTYTSRPRSASTAFGPAGPRISVTGPLRLASCSITMDGLQPCRTSSIVTTLA